VTATFRADETAQYQFFVGGMNPDAGVSTSTFMSVSVMLRRN
jgi:hypothetical protein